MKNIRHEIKSGLMFNTAVLIFFGIFTGYIFVQMIIAVSPSSFTKIVKEFNNNVYNEINFSRIFEISAEKCKAILLYYILCGTAYGRFYNSYVIIMASLKFSFYCCGMYAALGNKALLPIACNYFPGLLIMFPLYIMIIKQGFNIYKCYERGELMRGPFMMFRQKNLRNKILKNAAIIILTVIIAAVADAILKAYTISAIL